MRGRRAENLTNDAAACYHCGMEEFRHSHALGQNFPTDRNLLAAIVADADVKSGDTEDVDYEPVTKYATTGSVTLKKGVASVYLYADADCTVVLSSVTASDSLFLYGQSAYEGVYYCRLKGTAGTTRGYIGGEGIIVTLPEENTVEAVTPPEDEPEEENPGEETDPGGGGEAEVSLPVEIILVVSLAVPAFIVVFLLTRKRGS